MASLGIQIHSLTLQNEPQHSTPGYPSMLMSSQQQKELIRDHIGRMWSDHGIDTEIWIWDHNWDGAW